MHPFEWSLPTKMIYGTGEVRNGPHPHLGETG